MDAELYLWSVVVQWVSVAIIALAFGILSRSVKTRELSHWFNAWVFNLVAMSAAVGFWWLEPTRAPSVWWGALYAGGKLAFVFLLVSGARVLKGALVAKPTSSVVAVWIAIAIAIGSLGTIPRLGLAQQTLLAIGCIIGARVSLASPRSTADGWLGGAFALRGVLHLSEAAMYAVLLVPERAPAAVVGIAGWYASTHSFLDLAAEWLLALTAALAISALVQTRLREANLDLLVAQERLRALADSDPLTSLANRRSLSRMLESAKPNGALFLFFDIDGFKAINDQHGHRVGDECLLRFAQALRASFRPEDDVIRYAGDEFLIVCQGLDEKSVAARIARMREKMASGESLPVTFSVGIAELAPGADPEQALREADAAMYEAKRASE